MSTRAAIIMKTDTGYAGIYCHHDGYPAGVGQMLLDHYKYSHRVAALISLGDISSLGERINPRGPHSIENREAGATTAYHRDRGDPHNIHTGATLKDVEEQIGHDGYVYLFENGQWTCNGENPTDGKFHEEPPF